VASAAGVPRRTALGVDPNRVSLLMAVVERRCGIDVLGQDVFVNVAGGVRLSEPAGDLGMCAAIASSARGRPIDAQTLCFGEVGLAGEVRAVGRVELRLAEAKKLGFRRCVLPEMSKARLQAADASGIELIGVRDVPAALDALLP
jgi:DNA repair protein RadA/Sms